MTELHRLRAQLCQELARTEHHATLDAQRAAQWINDPDAVAALHAIAAHADAIRPQLADVIRDWTIGFGAPLEGSDDEQADALHAIRHGIDVARLLRAVAGSTGDAELYQFCERMLVERAPLVDAAEQAFAHARAS